MIDWKSLLISTGIAAALAVLVATCAHVLFPGWAADNSLIMALILGALAGTVYPLVVRLRS
jgi:hypothetical protein